MSRFFLVVCFFLLLLSAGADAAPLALKAFTLDKLSWQLAVNLEDCSINEKKLPAEACQKISALLQQVNADQGPVQAAMREAVGSYRYEFEINGKSRPVKFKAPEHCAIQPDGELSCERQTLSALEEMLLIFRQYK